MRNEQHEQNELKAMNRLAFTIAIAFMLAVVVFVVIIASFRKTPQKPFTRKISPAYRMIENKDTTGSTKDILTFYPDSL